MPQETMFSTTGLRVVAHDLLVFIHAHRKCAGAAACAGARSFKSDERAVVAAQKTVEHIARVCVVAHNIGAVLVLPGESKIAKLPSVRPKKPCAVSSITQLPVISPVRFMLCTTVPMLPWGSSGVIVPSA